MVGVGALDGPRGVPNVACQFQEMVISPVAISFNSPIDFEIV